MEPRRPHPLHPVGALVAEVLVEADLGPPLLHLSRRHPRLGQAGFYQQLAWVPGVQLVGLRPPFFAPGRSRLGRVGQVSGDPSRRALLDDKTPAGAAFYNEMHVLGPVNAGQPGPKCQAVSRADTAPLDLAALGAQVVESDL